MIKIFKKFYFYLTKPSKTFQSDIKLLHFYYSKLVIKYVHKFEFIEQKKYFYPNFSDLLFLIKIILKYNPKRCVEIGGGYSTFFILKALEKNFKKDGIKPSLLSFEQDEKYLEIHKKFLKENLNMATYDFLCLKKTNLEISDFLNTKVSRCQNLNINKIDFFYEDRTDHDTHKIAGDALILEHNSETDFIIVIDGMIKTVEFYKKNLKKNYKINGGFFTGTSFIPDLK